MDYPKVTDDRTWRCEGKLKTEALEIRLEETIWSILTRTQHRFFLQQNADARILQ